MKPNPDKNQKPAQPNIFGILGPYKGMVIGLVVLTLLSNAVSLFMPQVVSRAIDAYSAGTSVTPFLIILVGITIAVFVFFYVQSIMQTVASERVARDFRTKLADKISRQDYAFLSKTEPGKLLTNLTGDVDSIKMFVSHAVVAIVSSSATIIGSAVLLLSTNWRLGLVVLAAVPLIGLTFGMIFGRVKPLFLKSRQVIDGLNRVISESILGAALVRVVHGQKYEEEKFGIVNRDALSNSMKILKLFSSMIPAITLIANFAIVAVLLLGGRYVIGGTMTLGEFTAFNSYIALLIFPIIMIGFMGTIIAQSTASYVRVREVLEASDPLPRGTITTPVRGDIELRNVTVTYGEKNALVNTSFSIRAGTRTAIIGPTAAGKTQLIYLLSGLITPTSGQLLLDGNPIYDYAEETLQDSVAVVFQDSSLLNMTIRENIALREGVSDESLQKAIQTAELSDFVDTLPDGLDTIVSERGTTLSGGQKQRVMLARALAINPSVLLLDDFTARVDTRTEQSILLNLSKNYPNLTLVSVTQKISSVEGFDKIILLMEGEKLAEGTHQELLSTSSEYAQLYQSQQSTSEYE